MQVVRNSQRVTDRWLLQNYGPTNGDGWYTLLTRDVRGCDTVMYARRAAAGGYSLAISQQDTPGSAVYSTVLLPAVNSRGELLRATKLLAEA